MRAPSLSVLLRREKSTELQAQKANDAHHLAHMAARRAAHNIVWKCLAQRGIFRGSVVRFVDEKEAKYWAVNKLLLAGISIYPPSKNCENDGWTGSFTLRPFGSKNVPLLTKRYFHFSAQHPKYIANHIALHKDNAKP